jgi:hypothetical protein
MSDAPQGTTLWYTPAYVRLGWKGLAVTNTLAYYFTAVKSFMIEATVLYLGATTQIITTFSIMTLSIKDLFVTLSISDSQHK